VRSSIVQAQGSYGPTWAATAAEGDLADSPTIAEVETFLSHIVSAHRLRGPLNACQRQMG